MESQEKMKLIMNADATQMQLAKHVLNLVLTYCYFHEAKVSIFRLVSKNYTAPPYQIDLRCAINLRPVLSP